MLFELSWASVSGFGPPALGGTTHIILTPLLAGFSLFWNAIWSFGNEHADVVAFYFPLGVIGLWRWGVWLLKEIIALFYRPQSNHYAASVAIVTPVYNEDPKVFAAALESWKQNKPEEIIAVIDYTDTKCINLFQTFAKNFAGAKLIITKTPGKRPALVEGIKQAKGEIVALVDSDTVWADNVLATATAPFVDPRVGGVGTRQNVIRPTTIAQKLFDIQLDHRYADEVAFLAATKSPLTVLSGRTALYRRHVIVPFLDQVLHETFAGQKVISGEDKRLTYLVEQAGWKTAYQSSAVVYTQGLESMVTLFKQRLRWSRNSWRADLRALKDGWVWRHPLLALHLIDKSLQPFTSLISPIYFLLSVAAGLWQVALVILGWWHVSRLIKIYPHLKRRPHDVVILPVYILTNFMFSVTRIYALFSLSTQSWITRWDKERLTNRRSLSKVPAYAQTLASILVVGALVVRANQYIFSVQPPSLESVQQAGLVRVKQLAMVPTAVLGAATPELADVTSDTPWLYEVAEGDTMVGMAERFNMTPEHLLLANSARLPSWGRIEVGQLLVIPNDSLSLPRASKYNWQQKDFPHLQIEVNPQTKIITLEGRGTVATLAHISQVAGEDYLRELAPKEWLLAAPLVVKQGVTLQLTSDEVAWLKLKSNHQGFSFIQIESGALDMEGVKITSWDEDKHDVDTDTEDGRSYILAKFGTVVRIRDSEFAYLGFHTSAQTDAVAGVTAYLSQASKDKYLLTGEVTGSELHHNYRGLTLHGADGVKITGNHIWDNKEGLRLSQTEKALVRDNNVVGNEVGIRLTEVRFATLEGNTLADNVDYGVDVGEGAESNSLTGNTFLRNAVALRLSGNSNRVDKNIIKDNRTGVLLADAASDNVFVANTVDDNRLFGILVKTQSGQQNYLVEE